MRKNIEIQFTKGLQDHLINGAKIIYFNASPYNCVLVIRLPKGNFEKFDEHDNTLFEYIQYNQTPRLKLYRATYRNGHIREVKRRVEREYYDDWAHYERLDEAKKSDEAERCTE